MLKKIAKGFGYLLLTLVLILALFAAFNWTLVNNMMTVSSLKATEVDKLKPALAVKGCKGTEFDAVSTAFPAASFAEMKAFSDKHQGVGLVVLVDGKLVGEDYRPGATATTRAMSQSMNKAVTTMMIGNAIDEGIIGSVDDPVGTYIDEWKGQKRGEITLRQLLTMSSGLHNPSMAKMELAALNLMVGRVSKAALGVDIEKAPGEFSYANVNTQLAGMALSRALKKAGKGDYPSYLSAHLWCPLGNADATLWPEFEGGEPRYYAYLEASPRDWARVGELIRLKGKWGDHQLVPADWIDEMTTASPGNPNFGFNVWRGTPWHAERRYSKAWDFGVKHSAPYLAEDVYFLDGFGGQRVYVVPSAKLVIARLGETSMTWDDAALVNTALRGMGKK